MAEKAPFPSSESVASKILESGFLSDITLVCPGKLEFNAHSFVLYCHSEYFRGALSNDWEETIEKRFYLEDDSATIQAILEFMYCNAYAKDINDDNFADLLQLHIEVCLAADYYGAVGLAEYAEDRFHKAVKDWENAKAALPDVIRSIYAKDSKPIESIKQEVLRATLASMAELRSSQAFQELFREIGAFASDVLLLQCKEQPPSKQGILKTDCYKCSRDIDVVLDEQYNTTRCPRCGVGNYDGGLVRRKRF